MDIGSILLNQRFAVPIVPYTESDLRDDLAQGVGNVLAGVGSDFRLDVSADTGSVLFRHKDVNTAGLGAGYTGAVRTALGITASGIIAGYNRLSDGAWVNSLVIDGTTGSATFTGAINATSGNFTGTVTAGSIISGDATVNGVPISSFASGGYTTADLEADLAAGVASVIAGAGQDYHLTVNNTNIIAAQKNVVYGGTVASGSRGTGQTGLAITAGGIFMGYNHPTTGVWTNAVSITAAGAASFSGAINATSGSFTGTVTAGSIIANSVTVDGTALSTIKSNAAAGATAVQPAAIAGMLTSESSYILGGTVTVTSAGDGIRTGNIAWDSNGTVNAGSGVAITAKGLVGAVNGVTTFSINGTTGAAVFKGDVTGASGVFSGSISTSGYVIADGAGVSGSFGVTAAVKARASGLGAAAVYGEVTLGGASSGVYGKASSAVSFGVRGENASGVGGFFYGTTAIDCYGPLHIRSGTSNITKLREESGLIRMTDIYTTDAFMIMATAYGVGSGTVATLGPKLGTNAAMAGWVTAKIAGATIRIPYWT